jgi:hypothetical protein
MTAVAAAALIGCGGGGGGGGGGTNVVSVGTMVKGSVIVNGVTFEDNAARIVDDDGLKVSAADLSDGMVVTVAGTINADGVTGTASAIKVENEVRGAIEAGSIGIDTFRVHGQTVLVDGSTVFSNVTPTNISGLQDGDNVEVHGQRDAGLVIHATRVEKLGAGVVVDEVRGVVSGVTGTLVLGGTFSIGALSIATSPSTTIVPAGAAIANGTLVEVHLSAGTNNATRIEVEDLEDDEFEPAEGQEFEVEGLIRAFAGHPGTFTVGGESVQTTASTRFEGGLSTELANDVKVEAEGQLQSGILVAEKITFKENIRIEANAEANGSTNVLGLTVRTTSLTQSVGGTIVTGNSLRMRGFLNLDGTITATRVERSATSIQPDRTILQGPAVNVNATSRTLQIAGVTIIAAQAAPKDDNDAAMSLDQFFTAIGGTRPVVVKARGTFAAGVISAAEIEIE